VKPKSKGETQTRARRIRRIYVSVWGQESAKRALEVACAGGHNVLMKGAPGAGKTLLARALPGILPRLSLAEALEVTQVYSVADALPKQEPLVRTRPTGRRLRGPWSTGWVTR
jgi:predicted ATPase with chaperone activity